MSLPRLGCRVWVRLEQAKEQPFTRAHGSGRGQGTRAAADTGDASTQHLYLSLPPQSPAQRGGKVHLVKRAGRKNCEQRRHYTTVVEKTKSLRKQRGWRLNTSGRGRASRGYQRALVIRGLSTEPGRVSSLTVMELGVRGSRRGLRVRQGWAAPALLGKCISRLWALSSTSPHPVLSSSSLGIDALFFWLGVQIKTWQLDHS